MTETTWANPTYRRKELRRAVGRVDPEHPLACLDCRGHATGSADHFGGIRSCPTCHGYGISCPGCRGARFVRAEAARRPDGSPTGPTGTYLRPCPRCTVEINGTSRYVEDRELDAMEAWWEQEGVPF